MRFRLVWYDTVKADKFEADSNERHEYLGTKIGVFNLWWVLKTYGCLHLEIYNLRGDKQDPEKGLSGLIDYNI